MVIVVSLPEEVPLRMMDPHAAAGLLVAMLELHEETIVRVDFYRGESLIHRADLNSRWLS
jgi:hypothetical protein